MIVVGMKITKQQSYKVVFQTYKGTKEYRDRVGH